MSANELGKMKENREEKNINEITLERIVKFQDVLSKSLEEAEGPADEEMISDDIKAIDSLIEAMIFYSESALEEREEKSGLGLKREDFNSREEFQNAVKELDDKRRNAHNSLISSIGYVDRLCKHYKCEPIFGNLEEYTDEFSPLISHGESLGAREIEVRIKVAIWALNFVLYFSVDTEDKLVDVGKSEENPVKFSEMVDDFRAIENHKNQINDAIQSIKLTN